MTKTMPYWLYKTGYTAYPADNYNKAKKTIDVEIPDSYKKPRFPSDWKRDGNTYYTPNGCQVMFWGSGFAENFMVERIESAYSVIRETFPAGLDAREKVMAFVTKFN